MSKGGEKVHSIIIALVFNATDLVSGIIQALKNKSLQSAKLRDGLFKKIGFLICYFLAWLIDTYGNEIGFNIAIDDLQVVVLYVCLTETISVIENISKINSDLMPEKLMELFHIKREVDIHES